MSQNSDKIFQPLSSLTDPPTAPIISGYVEGSIIPAGSIQKLLCLSSGGNPLATLTWYKNDKKVLSSSNISATGLFSF